MVLQRKKNKIGDPKPTDSKGVFTLGVRDYNVESPNIMMLVI